MEPRDLDKIFDERIEIDKSLARAARQALIEHKALGHPVPEWRDGKVVWIAPEDIIIPPEP
ncbi:MAG TPA: hypothetical protein VGO93_14375 [Candidatus Xenobia bacterium]|jgi:hypothetical protein